MLQKENWSEGAAEEPRGGGDKLPEALGSGLRSLWENCGECLSTDSLFGANVSHISSRFVLM